MLLPQLYTYGLMKLFAFRDRYQGRREHKDRGGYHALDLYVLVATATEEEWLQAQGVSRRYRAHPIALEAAAIVRDYFGSPLAPGMLKLRESAYFRPGMPVEEMAALLRELFDLPPSAPP